ncbi:hypothetical protein GCM10009839_69290 [Catenulispora yoronensis]|uniref:Orc1-like AAA ATPase domain-containing protein n=1 Tax=Catenulispora yoronensis TaxID=450799 RepID=A0ABP5GR06_9ACTN
MLNGSARPVLAPPEGGEAPCPVDTLDPARTCLVGRQAELSSLLEAVASDLRAGPERRCSPSTGWAGSGKTTLALHACGVPKPSVGPDLHVR